MLNDRKTTNAKQSQTDKEMYLLMWVRNNQALSQRGGSGPRKQEGTMLSWDEFDRIDSGADDIEYQLNPHSKIDTGTL